MRDHEGTCMYTATHYVPYRVEPLLAEVLVIRWALEEAAKLELDTIVVETDCKEAALCFWRKKDISAVEFIVQDCRDLALQFQSFDLVHVHSECNKAAHLLANLASYFSDKFWWDHFPSALNPVLLADVFSLANY